MGRRRGDYEGHAGQLLEVAGETVELTHVAKQARGEDELNPILDMLRRVGFLKNPVVKLAAQGSGI